ncbi:oligosaccharide flippase family protein [Bdellovibrio sp. HCB288]|uniref:oligosaccharide flippase family protein n=1 Tax=Bdellovibrio sp. HCB288 TaxID=3394355 RepID=UPI0039B5C909
MIRMFLKDSFLYTLSNILSKGIGFLILPVYTAYFSPEQFGVLDMLLVSGNILSIFVGLEIHQAVARFFPEAESFEEKRKIVSTSLLSVLFFYFLLVVPALLMSEIVSMQFFKDEGYAGLIRVALISYGCNFLYYFASAQLRWQMKVKQNVLVSVLYSLISAGGAYLFLSNGMLGLYAVFFAQIIGAVVGFGVSLVFSKEYYGPFFETETFKKLTRFSLPLVFSTLTVYAMLYIDRFLINYLLSPSDLGLYGFAYRIASVIGLITMGTQAALTPIIYSKYKEPDTPGQIARLFNIFLLASIVLVACLFLGSDVVVSLMASSAYSGSSVLVPWIALSILFTGVINFVPGIFIQKITRLVLYINLIALFMNAVLGYVFIKMMGLMGAVIATAISSFCYFFLYYYLGQKYYFIPFFWTKIGRR